MLIRYGLVMFTHTTALLIGSLCGFSGCEEIQRSAAAPDHGSYTIVDTEQATFVLPSVIRGTLYRNQSFHEPECSTLKTVLDGNQRILEGCAKQPDGRGCKGLASLIQEAADSPGIPGISSRTQYWSIVAPNALFPEPEVTLGELSALGWDEQKIVLVEEFSDWGQPAGLEFLGDEASSWLLAMRIAPHAVDSGWTYDRATRAIKTGNQLLGCALASGEVSMSWQQDVEVSKANTAKVDTSLAWPIYSMMDEIVDGRELDSSRVYAYLGFSVSRHVDSQVDFDANVDLLAKLLFDETGRFIGGLNEEEFRQRIEQQRGAGDIKAQMTSRWELGVASQGLGG